MKTQANELLSFHRTGERPRDAKSDPATPKLCPALLSGYRDLTELRYDYPVVLVEGESSRPVRSVSSAINAVLQACAPRGIAGERMRKNVLALEREIRVLSSRGRPGSLGEVWRKAADKLLSAKGLSPEDKEALEKNLAGARGALDCDGQVIACDGNTPVVVVAHVWRAIQQKRSRAVKKELREILIKLANILKSDDMRSNDARTPAALKATVGTAFEDEFDFEAMSKVLPKAKATDLMPKSRRKRIEAAIAVLESQGFFGSERDEGVYSFEAKSCTEALKEFRKRLPKMVAFVRAIRVAELEILNAYREEKHGRFFAQLNEESLGADDIALFPSYLVCMNDKDYNDANKAALIEVLSSDLPIKVLFETSEVFESSSIKNGGGTLPGWTLGLANMAVGLGGAFVLQTTSSNLYQVAEDVSEGLECRGPALFSVFSGGVSKSRKLSPYLLSASAMQSRAFPTLVFNPGAGNDWAARFSVEANPQPDRVWPLGHFSYQDEDVQGVSEEIAFTLVDHLAADERFAENFMVASRSDWDQPMMPLGEYLQDEGAQRDGKVPYILMVSEDNLLHRVVVKQALVRAVKRYESSWRSLQELGGIGNSHALRLLERERELWEEEKKKEIEGLRSQLEEKGAAPTAEAPAAVEGEAEAEAEAEVEEISPDVPYIETARCSTCNECTNRNNKMFQYNENKQAYIADLEAGTYRQMVEAAEVCKLAIIHPGKPWNLDEPGLEELMKRAEPFL